MVTKLTVETVGSEQVPTLTVKQYVTTIEFNDVEAKNSRVQDFGSKVEFLADIMCESLTVTFDGRLSEANLSQFVRLPSVWLVVIRAFAVMVVR